MGDNPYLVEKLTAARLAELRAAAAQQARATAVRAPRAPLREVVGRALIRAGTWMAASAVERARA